MFTIQRSILNHDLDALTRYVSLNVRPGAFDGISIYPDYMLFQFHTPPLPEEEAFIQNLTNETALNIIQWKKDAIWRRIQTERDRRKSGGVKVGDYWFHSDDSSRIQQLALTMMGQNMPTGITWKTMSGMFVEMTPTLAQQIFVATTSQDLVIFHAAEVHKAQAWAMEDPENYDYMSNWPDTLFPGV